MARPEAATLEPRLGGIPDFYGALWSEARAAATRWHLAIVVEVAMIVAWFVIRSTAGVDGRFYAIWVIAAGVLALVAPLSGLVVFVATSVFYEPDTIPRIVPLRVWVLVPLAVGVLLRIAADRLRWRPGPAVWLALLIVLGTGLGVVNSFDRFPDEIAWRAARSWFNNMAGPVILLVAAAWTARGGSMRVLVVACLVAVVSGTVAVAAEASPSLVVGGPFDWVGLWKDFGARLGGTVPSPNALSAQLIVPTAVLGAALLLARDLRLKALALVGLVPLLVAHYLTFSRAPLLGAYVFAVVVAWRFRRWLGIAVLVVGVGAGALLLPSYLQLPSPELGCADRPRNRSGRLGRISLPGMALGDRDVAGRAGHRPGIPRVPAARAAVRRRAPRFAAQRVAAPVRGGRHGRRVARDRVRHRDDLDAGLGSPAGSAPVCWPGSSRTWWPRRSTTRSSSSVSALSPSRWSASGSLWRSAPARRRRPMRR